MRILKFGGTSLATADRRATLCSVIEASAAHRRTVAVVSALAGVTDALDQTANAACSRCGDAEGVLDSVEAMHRRALAEVAPDDAWARLALERCLAGLARDLDQAARRAGGSDALRNRMLAAGERMSGPLVAATLRARGCDAVFVDGGELIVTDDHGWVDQGATCVRARSRLARLGAQQVAVVSGFVGRDGDGRTTTLGRGGSDLSATVLGAALDADTVEIWTDVDGVFDTDPRQQAEAALVETLSHRQASCLAVLGASVLHPRSVAPLAACGTPLVVRNTLRPSAVGTRITGSDVPLRAVASSQVTAIQVHVPGGVEQALRESRHLAGVRQVVPTADPSRLWLAVDCCEAARIAASLVASGTLPRRTVKAALVGVVGGPADQARSLALATRDVVTALGVQPLAVAGGRVPPHAYALVPPAAEAQVTEALYRSLVLEAGAPWAEARLKSA